MTRLTPEETLRHIHHKVSSRELREPIAERMLELFEQNPTLDYAELLAAAMKREMPDVVFHTSSLWNGLSIRAAGLLAGDPAENAGERFLLGQPIGVYVSPAPDTLGVWAGGETHWIIWKITGAAALPHRQDPLNPEHFVIECDVPRDMVEFHEIATSQPHRPSQGACPCSEPNSTKRSPASPIHSTSTSDPRTPQRRSAPSLTDSNLKGSSTSRPKPGSPLTLRATPRSR